MTSFVPKHPASARERRPGSGVPALPEDARGTGLAERLHNILDCLPQMVWANEDQGRTQYYNRQWLEFTGVDLSKGRDYDRLSFVHPDDRPAARAAWEEAQLTGVYEHEYRLRHHTGDYLWVTSRGSPQRDRHGRITAWYGTVTDIHARKSALEALRASEALNRSIIGSSPDSILLLDLDARIVFLNEAAKAELGPAAAADIIGKNWLDAFPSPSTSEARAALDAALSGGRGNLTVSYRIAAGHYKCWDIAVTPVLNDERELVRVVVIARDVTEMRDAQERLHQLQSELIHVSRLSAMGTMASTLAHELNQPLTAIRNYMSGGRRLLGKDAGDTSLLTDVLGKAEKSAARAGEIIRRLRNMAQRGHAETTLVDIAAAVDEGLGLALVGSREMGVATTTNLRPGLVADIDAVQLQQVIINLVRNAIEAMTDSPRKELTVSSQRQDDDIIIRVEDTGEGLKPDFQQWLFEAFSTTKEEGLGVGLSICRTIIETHGGNIWAEASPSGGAIFSIRLPAKESAFADAFPERSCASAEEARQGHQA